MEETLLEAVASVKAFRQIDGGPRPSDNAPGNPTVDFHGEQRTNATHQSKTDPEARLYKKGKGKEDELVFIAHALMENRMGRWRTSKLPKRREQPNEMRYPSCLTRRGNEGSKPRR